MDGGDLFDTLQMYFLLFVVIKHLHNYFIYFFLF